MNGEDTLARIMRVGGFPEPFIRDSERHAKRWQRSHVERMVREDLVDIEVKHSEIDLRHLRYFATKLPEAKPTLLVHQLRNEGDYDKIPVRKAGSWLEGLEG